MVVGEHRHDKKSFRLYEYQYQILNSLGKDVNKTVSQCIAKLIEWYKTLPESMWVADYFSVYSKITKGIHTVMILLPVSTIESMKSIKAVVNPYSIQNKRGVLRLRDILTMIFHRIKDMNAEEVYRILK